MITGQNCSRRAPRLSYNSSYTIGPWLSPAPLGHRCYGRATWKIEFSAMSVGSIVKGERYRNSGKKKPENTREKQTGGSTICESNIHNSIFSAKWNWNLKRRTPHNFTIHAKDKHTEDQRCFSYSRISQYIIKSKAGVELAFNICA